MHLPILLSLSLPLLALAAPSGTHPGPSPLLKRFNLQVPPRDLTAIESDLSTVSADLTTISTAIEAWEGDTLTALGIYSDALTLESDIETATADVTSNGVLSAEDSATVYTVVEGIGGQINGLLTDVGAAVGYFEADGLTDLILSVLADIKSDADALFVALETESDSSYTDEFTALQATLDADYETVVAEF